MQVSLTSVKPCKNRHVPVQTILTEKLDLLTLLGFRIRLSVWDILRIIPDRACLAFFALVAVALATADPFAVHQYFPVWKVMLFWPIAIVMYTALSIVVLAGFAVLMRWFPGLVTPLPLKSAITMVPSVMIGENVAYALTGGAHHIDILERILFFYFFVQVFETVFYRFVVIQTETFRALQSSEPEPDTSEHSVMANPSLPLPTRHILIGAEKVPVSRVRHIEAREHHVHVTLDECSITHRARLSDIVAQTRPEDGFQPHRSWWVSKEAARGLERDGDRHVLKLTDDTTVPVARTRLPEVQNWVARHVSAKGLSDI